MIPHVSCYICLTLCATRTMKTEQPKIGKYANILLDRWFKRTFGSENSKRLLTLFLSELIPERKIVKLTYAPQEYINPFEIDKDIRVDVECIDEDGSRFVVEMQLAPQDGFYERALFNASFAVQQQIAQGAGGYRFPPVYFIGIMNFSMHEDTDKVLFRYELRENGSRELMSDRLQFLFLELPNCRKALTPAATVLDNVCYALHNMENLTDRPAELKEEIFRLLFKSAEIATFTPQERVKYQNDMTTQRDIQNQIAYAERKGEAKGLVKGKAEGRTETARNLKRLGVPVTTIAEATGLSSEEVAAL